MTALTPEQRAEVEQMIHDAIRPVARQVTQWLTQERRRLEQPRRSWTGAPVGKRPPGRFVPDDPRNRPPVDEKAPLVEPSMPRFIGDPHREG